MSANISGSWFDITMRNMKTHGGPTSGRGITDPVLERSGLVEQLRQKQFDLRLKSSLACYSVQRGATCRLSSLSAEN